MGMTPGNPCRHFDGSGCSIYPARPVHPCRTFNCGWIVARPPLPDDMRPDQCGAIVILGQNWKKWRVVRVVPAGWFIPDATLARIKNFSRSRDMPLIYHQFEQEKGVHVLTHRMCFGPPDFVTAFRDALEKEDAGRDDLDSMFSPGAAGDPGPNGGPSGGPAQ